MAGFSVLIQKYGGYFECHNMVGLLYVNIIIHWTLLIMNTGVKLGYLGWILKYGGLFRTNTSI